MRDKRDIRPVLLKFGAALALSLGGILYSMLRNRRFRPSQSLPSPCSSDSGSEVNSGEEVSGLSSDHHAFQTTHSSCKHESFPPKVAVDGVSPSRKSYGDKDAFLLPEFDEPVKEFDMASTKANISPRKDIESLVSDEETPREYKCVKRDEQEQEIKSLRNLVKILKERERTLEIQLLEYYGLKEQETAVMELQNRLKLNNMEAKLFNLKIESLQVDNRRLQEQVADYAKVVADLEAARTKLKLLKKKLRSEAEQHKEQILSLQQRVTKLHDLEHRTVSSDQNVQSKLQKLKDLEEEAEELRKSNYSLRLENSDLGRRLEYTQILATSVLEDEGAETLKEEHQRLRKQNEDLAKDIEQLQADRCADVEELVYLRWINACLRYELRNYQPGPGKTIARDLGKTLSPKSEEKAKQLILEYANKEGPEVRGINSLEFDSDQSSCSQASYLTDSGDCDSVDNSSTNKVNTSSKRKVFGKLMNLLRGKDGHHHSWGSYQETTACVEDMVGTYSSDSPVCSSFRASTGSDGNGNRSKASSQGSSRPSLDRQRSLYSLKSKSEKTYYSRDLEGVHRNNDSACVYKGFVSISEDVTDSTQENQLHQDLENDKSELMKYAEVLKGSRRRTSKFRRRSAAFNSF